MLTLHRRFCWHCCHIGPQEKKREAISRIIIRLFLNITSLFEYYKGLGYVLNELRQKHTCFNIHTSCHIRNNGQARYRDSHVNIEKISAHFLLDRWRWLLVGMDCHYATTGMVLPLLYNTSAVQCTCTSSNHNYHLTFHARFK